VQNEVGRRKQTFPYCDVIYKKRKSKTFEFLLIEINRLSNL